MMIAWPTRWSAEKSLMNTMRREANPQFYGRGQYKNKQKFGGKSPNTGGELRFLEMSEL